MVTRQIRRTIPAITLFIAIFLAGTIQIYAQENVVEGLVTDLGTGEPLAGVNVVVQGTTIGTATNEDGEYELVASTGSDTLIFSFIGFQKQIVPINGRSTIDVSLKYTQVSGEELVVVGYGTQKRKNVTGSVSSISSEELSTSQSTSITSRLQGRVPGVSVSNSGVPGEQGDIRIRGVSFLSGNNPLFVVDGVITDDQSSFNPNDVESIEVLKDATATAIYGSRAANGVVVVTTKGGSTEGLEVSFDVSSGIQQVPKRIDVADNFRWAEIITAARTNSDQYIPDAADSEFDPDLNTDWQDILLNDDALMQDYNISVSTGNEEAQAFFSLNYMTQEGTVEDPNFQRISARVNSQYSPTDNITIGENLTVARGNQDQLTVGLSDAINMLPVIPVYDSSNESGYAHGEFGHAETYVPNPVGAQNFEDANSMDYRILGNVFAEYDDIIEGLNYRLNVGIEYNQGNSYLRQNDGQIRMETTRNSRYEESRYDNLGFYLENRLTYQNEFGKHDLTTMLAHTEQRNEDNNMFIGRPGYDGGQFWVISAGTGNPTVGGSKGVFAIRSFLGRISYNYDGRYLLNVNYRMDGSSKFAEGNKWGAFPSASVGWNITEEEFFESNLISNLKLRGGYGEVGNADIANYAYQATISRGIPGQNYNLGTADETAVGATKTEFVERDITWQTLKEMNVGMDIALFEDKLSFSVDYYDGQMEDLLYGITNPGTIGAIANAAFAENPTTTINTVSMDKRGIEASVTYSNQLDDLQYSVTANAAHSTNEVTSLPFSDERIFGAQNITEEGRPVGMLYAIEFLGTFETQEEASGWVPQFGYQPEVGDAKYADVNGRDSEGNLTGEPDGKINNDDRQIVGSPYPDVEYGINLSGSYKSFDMSLNFQGVYGVDVYNGLYAGLNNDHTTNYSADFDPYIDGSGSDPRAINFPEHPNNLFQTSRFLEDGSYLRLKNVELSYNINWDAVDNLRVYFNAQNLFTITGYRGLDPDFRGGVFSRGVDPQGYPNVRIMSLGVNVSI